MERPLPTSIRYIKNGPGGCWWPAAKSAGQIHAGWNDYPEELILARDLAGLRVFHGDNPTQDYNALATLLAGPEHIWVTIQDGYLWWCTVSEEIGVDPDGSDQHHGHFWLVCDRPWSNRSFRGDLLAVGDLPGTVTQISSYRATVCEPSASVAMRRLILGEPNPDVVAAKAARRAFVSAVEALTRNLHPKDFEILIDLILQRTGWNRIARLGGTTEGVDVEVENPSTGEIAFVQIKSRAGHATLADYASRFQARRERYDRMIFAVHSVDGPPLTSTEPRVHIWDSLRIADLVVTLGLSDWLGRRL